MEAHLEWLTEQLEAGTVLSFHDKTKNYELMQR